jgi:hypothetical protein
MRTPRRPVDPNHALVIGEVAMRLGTGPMRLAMRLARTEDHEFSDTLLLERPEGRYRVVVVPERTPAEPPSRSRRFGERRPAGAAEAEADGVGD